MADEGVKGVMMVDSPPHQPQKKKSYIFSEEVQETSQFWLLTLWLLTFWLLIVASPSIWCQKVSSNSQCTPVVF